MGINHIHLLGGEPLIVQGIFDLIKYAIKKEIIVSINTNGTLLSEDMIKKLIESGVSQLTISLDGVTKETNDAIRGNGNFNLVTNNIRCIENYIKKTRSDLIIQVATVVTRQNISSIHKMPRLLHELNVKYLDILHLYECGNAINNNIELGVSDKEYLESINKIIIESYINEIYVQIDCKPLVLEILGKRYGLETNCYMNNYSGCYAGKDILFMNYKGELFPCGPFAHKYGNNDSEFKINLLEKNYLESHEKMEVCMRKMMDEESLMEKFCEKCKYKSNCEGCIICNEKQGNLCKIAYELYLNT
jgi:radical SAM protein with 4Fe4S-binding SPASM domain